MEPAAGLWPVKADPGQLEQVVMNLVVNARDAMPQGGILNISTANVQVSAAQAARLPALTAGPYVVLTIRDNGCGMDQETQAQIFEPFFTTKEPGKGTGLGLATVYGVVKQSGGYIWVDSEPGRGAAFHIYLPPAEGAAEAGSVPDPAPSGILVGAETILLVEDEEPLRRLAAEVLTGRGYVVLPAASGAEALRAAQTHQGAIDLLLTDVIMPGMSGRVLADRLSVTQPQLRVLFMSGYTDDAIAHHGVLEEGARMIGKPFTVDALSVAVRQALDEEVTVPASQRSPMAAS
jgi:two-component system, cell cycle sensor histidine kinase and response regulator CckA